MMSNENRFRFGGYLPGDQVRVVDGTFVGLTGEVLDFDDAELLWRESGGERNPLRRSPGLVCVALTIFGRRVPVWLQFPQIERG